jgi:tetratricopeptide (TPR) repeat protein
MGLLASHIDESIQQSYAKSYDYERVGNYEEAIKVLTPLYTQYPNGYTLNLRFGWLFFLAKKYTNAEAYYHQASLLKPQAIEPRLGLASVYLAIFSYNKAEMVCYEILKRDHYNYYANLYVSKALIAQKKYDEALKMIQKMLVIYPTNVSYLEQLAVIYAVQKSSYLEQLYKDILTLDPNNVFVMKHLH